MAGSDEEPDRDVSSVTMSDLPGVSLLCATFGRPPGLTYLTEECIQSFLVQDYLGPKELVILNDCASQELICDEPNVRVVNVTERYSSLGAKRNALVSLACYDLLAPADDDDIFLPHRISLSVRMLGSAEYFNPRAYWFLNAGFPIKHEQLTGYAHNASIFRKSAWLTVGGYDDHCREDATMDEKLRRLCRTASGWPLSAARQLLHLPVGCQQPHFRQPRPGRRLPRPRAPGLPAGRVRVARAVAR